MLMEKHSWLALWIIASVARRRVSKDPARLHTQTNCVACAQRVAASIKRSGAWKIAYWLLPTGQDSVCPADNDATGAGNVAAGSSR
jgi:hypothetical protein